ncbi:MAG: hypothetical protein ACREHG_02460, partial [Candidatus Saccharimonadales bacterium]
MDNTQINGDKNSFQKLMKDYGKQTVADVTSWTNQIIDKETLVGTTLSSNDTAINSTTNGDTGLYELYNNVIKPFVYAMISTADTYRTGANANWVSRAGYGPSVHGKSVSYCYGCKDRLTTFNAIVASCQAESTTQIEAREHNNTGYRGNLQDDMHGNCTVGN